METQIFKTLRNSAVALLLIPGLASAQDTVKTKVANLRPYDKSGINVFETKKETDAPFTGIRVAVGAGFTQSFQNLKHENVTALPANALYKITPGFNTANANLYLDAQLADGIRLNLTSYLSSRHHNETWVKGGYIQFDKLPFQGQLWDDIMKVATIKIGHMEINYGDQHFRRADGGHSLYSPFVENYILDAFTTEIGGEVYLQKNGLFGMAAVSSGMIKGNIDELVPTAMDDNIHKSPAFYFKGGIDRQFASNLRGRLSASYYTNKSSGGQTLYAGDRTGSNYFLAMELAMQPGATPVKTSTSSQFSSGRFNPGFSKQIDAIMVNGFMKASGLELFGTFEKAKGRAKAESTGRDATQIALDAVYRFGKTENLFIGGRYNTVKSEILVAGAAQEVNINRYAIGAGWFLTKGILLKGEYVNQEYKDFAASDYRNGGKFNGYVIQAAVGF